ncbi:UDP-glucosyltransferase 2-like [Chironomus tepperi]|uniref:UDP-glucosyltransferase 2-like n=1 Tax=Chironomus tepperi TaxID=113505 RepID=UPI00391F6AF2
MEIKMKSFLIFIAIFMLGESTNGHRILGLFPHPGYSHFKFFQPIMMALADAGHDVTVVSQFPNKEPHENYKDELLNDIGGGMLNVISLDMFKKENTFNHFWEFFVLKKYAQDACEHALNSSAIKNIFNQGRREPFDLIIVEMFNTDCMLGVAEKLKAPIIGLSSCNIMPWHATKIGLPYEPGFLPTTFLGHSDHMTFGERLSNWLTLIYMNVMYKTYIQSADNAYLKSRFGDDFPKTSELIKKVSMVFVNQHYSLNGAKHLSPNVIELGGVHIGKPKTLDPELQKLLDTAEHGVIYISWGSMVKADTLSEAARDGILKALGKFKQRVIWKYENETLPNQPSNVIIRKWMPQREILCHPNVRVFMTHGGLLGSLEAVYCGVPVISTPFYGDQFLNSAALESRGMGVVLNYIDMNEHTVHHALRKVLDLKYRQNAKKVQYSFKHRPLPPKEAAVYWSEYVIATKGAELVKPYTVHAKWLVYSGTDIFLFVSISIITFIATLVHLIKKLVKNGSKKTDKVSQERKTK